MRDLKPHPAKSKLDIGLHAISQASDKISDLVVETNLEYCERLSNLYSANIYLKREDQQRVRSYKIRGAYNFIKSLTEKQQSKGIMCASAGNHAQGVALCARELGLTATIFMPTRTPLQKIGRVKQLGGKYIKIRLAGDNFDESNQQAIEQADKTGKVFVPPFDDLRVITGQATVAKEIDEKLESNLDIVVCPIGGGGLVSGVCLYFANKKNHIEIIGVEPQNADAMNQSLKTGKLVSLPEIDTFVDGAAVKRVGVTTFNIVKNHVKHITVVPVGAVCAAMIDLYQEEGIISEPAGALSVSALESLKGTIKGKTVVCIISGGNNDILRYPEIMEKSLTYKGLKHYFILELSQKPGQLKTFVNSILGPTDDIVRFEYLKKTSKEVGPALVGVEVQKTEDFNKLINRLGNSGIQYKTITSEDIIYRHLV